MNYPTPDPSAPPISTGAVYLVNTADTALAVFVVFAALCLFVLGVVLAKALA